MLIGLIVLGSILQQESEFIPKSCKDVYVAAVKQCRDAESRTAGEPAEAIRILDAIIDNQDVKKKECPLRIEIASGDIRREDFFPYRARGRARMKMAGSATADSKEKLLEGAVADFEVSAARLAPESPEDLRRAKETLQAERRRRATPVPSPADPEPEFRQEWTGLLAEERFADAAALIEVKGAFLSAGRKADYVRETDARSTGTATTAAVRFARELALVQNARDLRTRSQEEFERSTDLPPRGRFSAVPPAFEWCIAARTWQADLRSGKQGLPVLLDLAVAALAFPSDLENSWFTAAESLAFRLFDERAKEIVEEARPSARDRRDMLRQDAEALVALWESFEGRVIESLKDRSDRKALHNRRTVRTCLVQFPVDRLEFSAVCDEVRLAVTAEDPERELEAMQQRLREQRAGWDRWAVESRRALVSGLVVLGALRGFLAGLSPDEIARDARDLGEDLRHLGGACDAGAFGPKVSRVFALLGK